MAQPPLPPPVPAPPVVAQTRLIILNVKALFCRERDDAERQGDVRTANVLKKTCDATDVSEGTVKNFRRETQNGQVKAPEYKNVRLMHDFVDG